MQTGWMDNPTWISDVALISPGEYVIHMRSIKWVVHNMKRLDDDEFCAKPSHISSTK
jgi:hypothetical protein